MNYLSSTNCFYSESYMLLTGGDSKLYICEFCTVPFSTLRSLNLHKSKSHAKNPTPDNVKKEPLDADDDTEKMNLEVFLRKQFISQGCKGKCSFCEIRFTSKQTMKAHYQRAHFRLFSNIYLYICSRCDFITGNETSFLHHKAAINDCTEGNVVSSCSVVQELAARCRRLRQNIVLSTF